MSWGRSQHGPGDNKAGLVPQAMSVPKAVSVISSAPAEPGSALSAPPAQRSEQRNLMREGMWSHCQGSSSSPSLADLSIPWSNKELVSSAPCSDGSLAAQTGIVGTSRSILRPERWSVGAGRCRKFPFSSFQEQLQLQECQATIKSTWLWLHWKTSNSI